MPDKLRRFLREPLVHFLLLSVGIYGLYAAVAGGSGEDAEQTIVISAAEIGTLREQWERTWQRPPTPEELTEVIRGSVRTQVLYREAVAMGLDEGDTFIERRLAQRLETLAKSLLAPGEPSEDELRAWFGEHEDQFRQPDRFSIVQVYFNPDRREAATLDDARAALDELQAMDGLPADIASYGDRLMAQNYYEDQTEMDLRKLFGSEFAQRVSKLEPGLWSGPILSGYGTHLVFVTQVTPAPLPDFAAFAEQARDAWMAARAEDLGEQFVQNLIDHYEVTIERTDPPSTGGR